MNTLLKLPFTSLLISSLAVLILGGCDKSQPNIELIQDQMIQENVKAQEYDDFFADGISSRLPPVGTKPIGFNHYKFATDAEGSVRQVNPLAGNNEPEVLLTGQKYFETHCMVCHGIDLKSQSDMVLSGKFPLKIPPLDSDKIKGWTDGQIYHVITVGQGVMGPYASHVPQSVRWQVVNYIRYLQRNEK